MKYPKIHSLFRREQFAKCNDLIIGDYACQEFANIKTWLVSEKIDGMNIRIHYIRGMRPTFAGRTDNAQLPPKLLAYLQEHFTRELFYKVFEDAYEVMLFGEGYGAKIQSGGYYAKDQRFVLFDVFINDTWWMEWDTVIEMANKLGIPTPPILCKGAKKGTMNEDEIIQLVKDRYDSGFAEDEHVMEGVVARAYPMLLFRDGTPVKFKLKCRDFKDD